MHERQRPRLRQQCMFQETVREGLQFSEIPELISEHLTARGGAVFIDTKPFVLSFFLDIHVVVSASCHRCCPSQLF
jgi:hypothetical protein